MNSMFVPLVKNKNGNIYDVNNYRAVAESNSMTKIFAIIMFENIRSMHIHDCDKYQLGFKAVLSTTLCTKICKQTIDCFVNRGTGSCEFE